MRNNIKEAFPAKAREPCEVCGGFLFKIGERTINNRRAACAIKFVRFINNAGEPYGKGGTSYI